MSASFLVIRADLMGQPIDAALDHARHMQARLQAIDGFEGVSAWQREGVSGQVAMITSFRSSEAVEAALKRYARGRLLLEGLDLSEEAILVHQYIVTGQDGLDAMEAPAGSFMSLSERLAQPGYSDSLDQELEDIFGQLSMTSGYLGSARAVNSQMPDQLLGLVLWSSLDAFARSLPENLPYEIGLFRKLQ